MHVGKLLRSALKDEEYIMLPRFQTLKCIKRWYLYIVVWWRPFQHLSPYHQVLLSLKVAFVVEFSKVSNHFFKPLDPGQLQEGWTSSLLPLMVRLQKRQISLRHSLWGTPGGWRDRLTEQKTATRYCWWFRNPARKPTTIWMVLKPWTTTNLNWWVYQPQLVSLADFWLPSTVHLR